MIGISGRRGGSSVRKTQHGGIGSIRSKRPVRTLALGLVAAGAFTGASHASDDKTLAQPSAAPTSVARWAATYVDFRTDIDALDRMALRSAGETREAHRRLGTHDPYKLAEGWMAYAALVAADDPTFLKALRKELRRSNRDKILKNIGSKPRYISNLPGAGSAVQAILRTAAADAAKMNAIGEKFRDRSYELQETSWGVKPSRDQQERLAAFRTETKERTPQSRPAVASRGLSGPMLASAGGDWNDDWGGSSYSRRTEYQLSGPRAQPVIDQILVLAAQHALGVTEGANAEQARTLLRNDKARQCFNWAKLHLDQCIAATRAPYEEAYCLGRHGLDDVAECVGWIAASG
ncbi:MAG: hypothetical protein AAGL49_11470 [Pseudomonadota bacterium]